MTPGLGGREERDPRWRQGVHCSAWGRTLVLSGSLPAHTADRSTRWADWLLLSHGLNFVEAGPGLVPLTMSELKGFVLTVRAELLVRDQTLVLCLKAALTSEFRRQ